MDDPATGLWLSWPSALGTLADLALAAASFAITLLLVRFARRRPDLGDLTILRLFSLLMAGFGVAHLVDAFVALPLIGAMAPAIKAAAALVGIATAAGMRVALPRALALPTLNRLMHANTHLGNEVARRQAAEAKLRESYAALERKVAERTQALSDANAQLSQEIDERRRTEARLRASEADLTRLRDHLEDHIALRTAQLTKTIAELEAFSYSVSHDLRAPLRAINGYAAILRDEHGGTLPPEAHELLAKMGGNAAKMAQLIDGLLDFSRLARVEHVAADVDMASLAHSALFELQLDGAQMRRVRIGALPPAHGDAGLLRQVFLNLLSNAIKFSSERPNSPIEVTGEIRDGRAVYRVADLGIGFDMAYADKLFGVFQRLHPNADYPGVGVGLAIVRRIVERHGGRVWAESVPGAGSTFCVELPPVAEVVEASIDAELTPRLAAAAAPARRSAESMS